MTHPSPLAWSYLVLFGGIAIVIIGIAFAFYGSNSGGSQASRRRRRFQGEDPLLRKRMEALEEQMRAGGISREEYNRRRTEILVESYKRHAS